jgi:hypothetical protein
MVHFPNKKYLLVNETSKRTEQSNIACLWIRDINKKQQGNVGAFPWSELKKPPCKVQGYRAF